MLRYTLLSVEKKATTDTLNGEDLAPWKFIRRSERTFQVMEKYLSSKERCGKYLHTRRISKSNSQYRQMIICEASKSVQSVFQLRVALQLPMSKIQVHRILQMHSTFRFRRFKKASPLTEQHRKPRLRRDCIHHARSSQQWDRVIFSNDKSLV